MNAEYYIADPTGNITILVATPTAPEERVPVAARLLAAEKTAEQVGFLSAGDADADITLTMAGGEFCGNATLSAAALYFMQHDNAARNIKVRVSGAEIPVNVEILSAGKNCFRAKVEMPVPLGIGEKKLEFNGQEQLLPVVQFKGISHVISAQPMEKNFAEAAAEKWCADLKADALGIMQLKEENELLPYVFVSKGRTGYWESSCASGTTAAGYYLAVKNREDPFEKEFSEPAGKLRIAYEKEKLFLTGNVRIDEKKREA